jgi:hypothetical protein
MRRANYTYLMYLSGVDALARFMSMGLNERELEGNNRWQQTKT